MRLSVAVQHHPARAGLLPALLASLEPLPVDVVTDPDPTGIPDAWRSYRPALERTPEWATHRVVLQDDVRVCGSFATVLERAVAAQPDALLVLCVCGLARLSSRDVERAAIERLSWARLVRRQWVPTIGLAWPAELVPRALEWVDAQDWPRMFRADDEVAGRIADGLGLDVLATVPSIVQHDDLVESLTGRPAGYGRNPQRVATLFSEDALGVDWSRGPERPTPVRLFARG